MARLGEKADLTLVGPDLSDFIQKVVALDRAIRDFQDLKIPETWGGTVLDPNDVFMPL